MVSNGLEFSDLPLAFEGPSARTMNVLISNNRIHSSNPRTFAAIDGFLGASDFVVTNNQITGTYRFSAIAMGYAAPPFRSDNWMIQGNNLQNVTVGLAPIWLGPFTSDNTVIGGSNQTNVLDQGTNNTLVGVNNMQGGIGQDLKEALEEKRNMLSSGGF